MANSARLVSGSFSVLILGGLLFSACSCEEDQPIVDTGVPTGADALPADYGFDDSGNPIDGGIPAADALPSDYGFDDAGNPIDGGFPAADALPSDYGFDDAGNPIDGGFPARDGGGPTDGNPLEEPLSEFCRGTGTVVIVGGGDQCAGTIAENTFRFALCTCESATLQSTLLLDSFDSNAGVYGGSNIASDGQLGSNGPLSMDGKLIVHGSAFVGGNAFQCGSQSEVEFNLYSGGPATQPMSSTSVGRNAYINGNVSGRYNIAGNLTVPRTATVSAATLANLQGQLIRGSIPALQPCACGEDEILDIGALTAFGRTHNDNAVRRVLTATTWADGTGPDLITLPCGRYYLTRINHPHGLTIRAEDRTVLFVDGDMTIGGNINLDLLPGAEIDLFVKGSLSVQAAARFGSPDAPSKVRTYVGGTSTITFSASSDFGGNLYAPRAHVIFGASANLYGALFARSVEFNGAANIHFDTAVRRAGQSCQPPPTDGGTPGDAGTAGDAGGADAATSDGALVDAGTPGDATAGQDAAPTADAGSRDATVTADAGIRDATPSDSGTAPDSGVPTGCTGCFQCGDLACIGNQCAPCRTDFDCCAPQVCTGTGQCIFPL